jgi:hypothetical protein
MKITFAHRIDRNNVGDYWSCPIHYYSEYLSGYELSKIEIKKIKGKMHSQTSPLIIGGGGLIGEKKFDAALRSIAEENQSKLKIIWAAGDNVSKPEEPRDFLSYIYKFDLVGIRDYIKGHEKNWVPCVSCKSKYFDIYYDSKIRNEVVYFEHLYKPISREIIKKYPGPVMTNNGIDFEGVISFLSSANYVFTNSYHGAYWAQLLGKKVISNSWSTKFKNMKHPVAIAEQKHWHDIMNTTQSYNILQEYRNKNDEFFNKIKERL